MNTELTAIFDEVRAKLGSTNLTSKAIFDTFGLKHYVAVRENAIKVKRGVFSLPEGPVTALRAALPEETQETNQDPVTEAPAELAPLPERPVRNLRSYANVRWLEAYKDLDHARKHLEEQGLEIRSVGETFFQTELGTFTFHAERLYLREAGALGAVYASKQYMEDTYN